MYCKTMFVPDYLKKVVLANVELGAYDYDDLTHMDNIIRAALTSGRLTGVALDEDHNKLITLYHKPGTYVFDDNIVSMNGEKVFEIIFRSSKEEEYTSGHKEVFIICYKGSTNLLINRSFEGRKAVASWLVGYMFKNLDEKTVLNTSFFKDYWLNY